MSNLFFREISETMQNIPAYVSFICAAGVGICTIGAGTCWLAKKVTRGARQIVAVSFVGAVLVGGMVVVGTDTAGAKPTTNDVTQVEGGTNTMTQTEVSTNVLGGAVQGRARSLSAPQRVANGEYNGLALRRVRRTRPTMLSPITDNDIAQGWRVVSMSSNALETATFTMPPHATVWESAQAECKMKS